MRNLLLTSLSGLIVVSKPIKEQPNFVIIVTDSFDGRIIEHKNYKPIVDLNNIEKLQDEGTTYQRTYCDYPICCPSRTALLSGRRNDVTHAWVGDFSVLSWQIQNDFRTITKVSIRIFVTGPPIFARMATMWR